MDFTEESPQIHTCLLTQKPIAAIPQETFFPLSSTQWPQKMQSETCTKSGQWTDMTFHRKWKQMLMYNLHKAVFPLCLGPYLAFSQMSPDVVWDYCWNFFSCIYVMKQYLFQLSLLKVTFRCLNMYYVGWHCPSDLIIIMTTYTGRATIHASQKLTRSWEQ